MQREGTHGGGALGPFTDTELVKLAQGGSKEAFDLLVVRYQARMARLARRLTETEEDAEDVLQEAFVRAHRSISTFRADSKFSTWMYRITVNFALMKRRSRRSNVEYLDDPVKTKRGEIKRELVDTAPDPLSMLMAKENRELLERAISDLPKRERTVFLLRHVDGMSTQQASKALKLSVPAMKSRLHRSKLALRYSLSKMTGEEVLTAAA